jgi:mono/diheme cytochrome c family protein
MREQLARWAATVTAAVLVALVGLFAWVQNREALPPDEPTVAREQVDSERLERGRQVYEEQDCSMCHAIAGDGNPRNPLDGVGNRLDADEIGAWIVGEDVPLPDRVRRTKRDYRALDDDEMEALIAFMQSI